MERSDGQIQSAPATLPSLRALVKAVFAQSPFATALYDREGRFAAGNPAYERHWGIRIADVPPDCSLFTDPQLEQAGLTPLIRRAYAGEHVALPPVRYDAAAATGGTGRSIWTQGHCFPLRDDAGAVTHVTITFIDITAHVSARGEAERSRERTALLQVLTAAFSAVLTRDDVIRLLFEHGVEALGAATGIAFLRSADGYTLELAGARGYPPGILDSFGRVGLDALLPAMAAVRSGVSQWTESADEAMGDYARWTTPGSSATPSAHARRRKRRGAPRRRTGRSRSSSRR